MAVSMILLLVVEVFVTYSFGQSTTFDDDRCAAPGFCQGTGSPLEDLVKNQQELRDIVQGLKMKVAEQTGLISVLQSQVSDTVNTCCSNNKNGTSYRVDTTTITTDSRLPLNEIRANLQLIINDCERPSGVVTIAGAVYASCAEESDIRIFDVESTYTSRAGVVPNTSTWSVIAACHQKEELLLKSEGNETIIFSAGAWYRNITSLETNFKRILDTSFAMGDRISVSDSCKELLILREDKLTMMTFTFSKVNNVAINRSITEKILPYRPLAILKRDDQYIVAGPFRATVFDRSWNTLSEYKDRIVQNYPGYQESVLGSPVDLALFDDGRILVADTSQNRIVLLESDLSMSAIVLNDISGINQIDYDPTTGLLVVTTRTVRPDIGQRQGPIYYTHVIYVYSFRKPAPV